MMRALLCFLLALVYSMSNLAKARTFDRLVLEVNGKSYSQRQIEVYQAIRTIASGEPTSKGLPGPEGWERALESFRNEMMIYINIENDAEKMDSLPTNHKAIQKIQDKLEALVAGDDKWRDFFQKYHISDRELTEQLIRMFKVQAYLESRVRPAGTGQAGAVPFLKIDLNADWYTAILHATPHRLYDRGREYRVIQPFGG